MTVRFFMLQAHYRSTLDFSNEALGAAEKGFNRLMNAMRIMEQMPVSNTSTSQINKLVSDVYAAMNDDFNTPITLSHLFEGVRIINSVNDLKETITEDDKNILVKMMHEMVYEVLGLKAEDSQDSSKLDGLMQMILQQRVEAKQRKDFATSDKIRDKLKEIGFDIKDGKDGTTYSVNN